MAGEFRKQVSEVSKRVDNVFWKRFIVNLEITLKKDYYPKLLEKIMENYKLLPGGPPDDPTALEKWEEVFRGHFESERVVNESIVVSEDQISIGLADRAFLGYGREGDDESFDPIIWMVYFISDTAARGILGRFAFISKFEYESFRGSGSYLERWGRAGEGFMLSEEEYNNEGWEEVLGPFDNKEHPLSEMLRTIGPINIFENAVIEMESTKDKIFSYVDRAIQKTLKEMETAGI